MRPSSAIDQASARPGTTFAPSSSSTRPAKRSSIASAAISSTGPAGSRLRMSASDARWSVPPGAGAPSAEVARWIGAASRSLHDSATAAQAPATTRAPLALARIEGIAKTFTEHVEAPDGQEDRDPGGRDEPGRDEVVVLPFGEHASPRGRRRRDADAEVAERAVGHDHLG